MSRMLILALKCSKGSHLKGGGHAKEKRNLAFWKGKSGWNGLKFLWDNPSHQVNHFHTVASPRSSGAMHRHAKNCLGWEVAMFCEAAKRERQGDNLTLNLCTRHCVPVSNLHVPHQIFTPTCFSSVSGLVMLDAITYGKDCKYSSIHCSLPSMNFAEHRLSWMYVLEFMHFRICLKRGSKHCSHFCFIKPCHGVLWYDLWTKPLSAYSYLKLCFEVLGRDTLHARAMELGGNLFCHDSLGLGDSNIT